MADIPCYNFPLFGGRHVHTSAGVECKLRTNKRVQYTARTGLDPERKSQPGIEWARGDPHCIPIISRPFDNSAAADDQAPPAASAPDQT